MADDYKLLYETERLRVGHVHELAYLTTKATGQMLFLGNFYGNPTCGLISRNNDWCLVGGLTLVLWTQEEVTELKNDDLKWIHALRQTDDQTVQLLTDPWADDPAIWEFSVTTRQKRRLKDFPNYKDQAYTDAVSW